jgi:hypothetical protein
MVFPTDPHWSKFAKNCFLFHCGNCGEHFLVSQKATYQAIKDCFHIICPHCSNGRFSLKELSKQGNFHRKPIILQQEFLSSLRILDAYEVLGLLQENKAPQVIPVVTFSGEHLDSDAVKKGKVYLVYFGICAVIGAISIISGMHPKDDEQNTES